MDVLRVRSIRRFRAISVLQQLFRAVFRRRALRFEGRIASHGGVLPPSQLPQLVSTSLSLHLRDIPAGDFLMLAQALDNEFARAVRAGLTRGDQKTLPCRYFYDAVGSALFEAITYLPEYGLTRADASIIERHAPEIVAAAPAHPLVAELGSGTGTKTRKLLERMDRVRYCPIDVSAAALACCARELAPVAEVQPIAKSYLEGLAEASAQRRERQPLLVLFLGSTIGNFDPEEAAAFLWSVRERLAPGDALLLGTDLVKPAERLLAAYDDPTGVTAAFNLNLLARINRELGADFDLRRFEHLARYNAAAQRVEMHLLSLAGQCVHISKAGLIVRLEAGETIHTESSHKFESHQISGLARSGGFRVAAQWTEAEWGVAETLMYAV
jgi:dimethylhistidine N-methyltransferase